MKKFIWVGLLGVFLTYCKSKVESPPPADFCQLEKYSAANEQLLSQDRDSSRVVLMGNSITEGWPNASPDFFKNDHLVNRGISGQTTIQMLGRFQADVIALKPHTVVILAGTNDIAGNTGDVSLEEVRDNFRSMIELAQLHQINVVVCSVLPASKYRWRPGKNPAERIPALNELLKKLSEEKGVYYLDYFGPMANSENGLSPELAEDGVHPTALGYQQMEALLSPVLDDLVPAWKL